MMGIAVIIYSKENGMSDSLITHKENNHNTPMHYNMRKDFNELVNSFFNSWFDTPLMSTDNAVFKSLEPKIEVSENENNVSVRAEMPGMTDNDIELEVSSDGYLTISGEKKQEKTEKDKGNYFSEISYGSFKRTVPLPWDLKYNDAQANFENGILQVMIPKSTEEKSRKKKISISKK